MKDAGVDIWIITGCFYCGKRSTIAANSEQSPPITSTRTSYSLISSWKLSFHVAKECRLNSWSSWASVCLWLIYRPYLELKGRAFYITQWQSEFRHKCFLDNEIWSKRQGKAMFMSNEPMNLFLSRILNFCAFDIDSNSVPLLIPMTPILPLTTGRSASGVIWPSPCLCSPCVSAVLRSCRSAGSATVTSWPNLEFTSRCSPLLPSFGVGPNPSLRYHKYFRFSFSFLILLLPLCSC